MGLPIAREGSPRVRAFSPRDQDWPLAAAMVHLSVAAVALGCTPFLILLPFADAVSWLLSDCWCRFGHFVAGSGAALDFGFGK